jgi:hypothetical protein
MALIVPWFVYQFVQEGVGFWGVIFDEHVFTRFTVFLDPAHLQPWYFYFHLLWTELGYAQSIAIALAGLVAIVWHAWTGQPWTARLLLFWWLAPIVLMSMMTSKLHHYMFPFLPPVAIGAGWAAALIVRAAVWCAGQWRVSSALAGRPRLRTLAFGLAVGSIVMAIWTLLNGEPVTLMWGEMRVFRNSSVLRPLVIAGVLLTLAGRGAVVVAATGILVVMALLPINRYSQRVARAWTVDLPLHAARACLSERLASIESPRPGLYVSGPTVMGRHHEYYFLGLRPWEQSQERLDVEARERLFQPGRQTPMLVSLADWRSLEAALGFAGSAASDPDSPAAVMTDFQTVLLLPGAYRVCAAPMLAAGADPVPPA